jgi:hypothetical protein
VWTLNAVYLEKPRTLHRFHEELDDRVEGL